MFKCAGRICSLLKRQTLKTKYIQHVSGILKSSKQVQFNYERKHSSKLSRLDQSLFSKPRALMLKW